MYQITLHVTVTLREYPKAMEWSDYCRVCAEIQRHDGGHHAAYPAMAHHWHSVKKRLDFDLYYGDCVQGIKPSDYADRIAKAYCGLEGMTIHGMEHLSSKNRKASSEHHYIVMVTVNE